MMSNNIQLLNWDEYKSVNEAFDSSKYNKVLSLIQSYLTKHVGANTVINVLQKIKMKGFGSFEGIRIYFKNGSSVRINWKGYEKDAFAYIRHSNIQIHIHIYMNYQCSSGKNEFSSYLTSNQLFQ